ncbi:hypothetical protein ACFQ9Q_34605 [Streptomyces virginiae]|uniref:hypothetical protein n=1 Tax=Streptomyces virginiae TaxID=1961 RepID=UPI00368DB52D
MAAQDDPGSDQSGADTSGSDTGNQQDGSHPQGTDTGNQQDGSHPQGTDTGNQQDGSHPQGTDKLKNPLEDNGGRQPPSDTVKQPGNGAGEVADQQACEKAGGIWAENPSGGYYCGQFNKLQGTQKDNPTNEVKTAETTLVVTECAKFFLPAGWALKAVDAANGVMYNLSTGQAENVIGDLIPGAKCLKGIKSLMPVEQVE